MRTVLCVLLAAGATFGLLASREPAHAKAEPKNQLPAAVVEALTKCGELDEFNVVAVDPQLLDTVPAGRWKVVARQAVDETEDRQRIAAAVQKAVGDSGLMPDCILQPRHAIEVTHDERRYVLLICFECSQLVVYVDGARRQLLTISSDLKPLLDETLRDAIAKSKKSAEGDGAAKRPPAAGIGP
ncbi:MAG TPA: hypothetical protein VMF30_14050 [Pirellulales bacterium]|nr:hypothetical protein [Pirellulales bacterium]